jgi:hypothetical protein
MPSYNELYPVGSTVRIIDLPRLEEFQRTWKWHHNVTSDQLAFAGRIAIVKDVGFYHGGDVFYNFEGIPGTWHEQCVDASWEGTQLAPAAEKADAAFLVKQRWSPFLVLARFLSNFR